MRKSVLIPWMPRVDLVPERILLNEHLLPLPVLIERVAEEDPEPEIDLHEIVRDELPVDHDARRHEHPFSPRRHVLVLEVAIFRVLEGAPAPEQDAAVTDFFVPWKRLVEEVE